MAKEVAGLIKLQIKGGAANPSPPVGPALGSKGINIMEFCKQFNARTQDKAGKILPVIITYTLCVCKLRESIFRRYEYLCTSKNSLGLRGNCNEYNRLYGRLSVGFCWGRTVLGGVRIFVAGNDV